MPMFFVTQHLLSDEDKTSSYMRSMWVQVWRSVHQGVKGSKRTSHWLDPNVFPLHLWTEPSQITAVHIVYIHDRFFVSTWKEKKHHVCTAISWGYQIRKVWWRLHPRPDPLEVCRGLDSRQHSRTAWSAKSASLEEWWSLDIWIQPWHPLVACWVPCERSLTTLSSSCSPVGTRCLLLPTQQKPKESWRSRPSFSKIATSSPALL